MFLYLQYDSHPENLEGRRHHLLIHEFILCAVSVSQDRFQSIYARLSKLVNLEIRKHNPLTPQSDRKQRELTQNASPSMSKQANFTGAFTFIKLKQRQLHQQSALLSSPCSSTASCKEPSQELLGEGKLAMILQSLTTPTAKPPVSKICSDGP